MHRSNELYPVQARAIFAAFLFHLQTTVILSHIKSLSASGMKVVQMYMDGYSMLLQVACWSIQLQNSLPVAGFHFKVVDKKTLLPVGIHRAFAGPLINAIYESE